MLDGRDVPGHDVARLVDDRPLSEYDQPAYTCHPADEADDGRRDDQGDRLPSTAPGTVHRRRDEWRPHARPGWRPRRPGRPRHGHVGPPPHTPSSVMAAMVSGGVPL